ncbi:MAG: hypothetical protein H6600_01500 [Flavobacteriales bacterium]|nr:hypothetical protein [Flavobacteriales bacterium]
MSLNDNHIDQLFKDKLSEETFQIPNAFTEDLNQRLDAKFGKKKSIWFWSWLGVALVAGVVSVFWLNLVHKEPISNNGEVDSSNGNEYYQLNSIKTIVGCGTGRLLDDHSIEMTKKLSDSEIDLENNYADNTSLVGQNSSKSSASTLIENHINNSNLHEQKADAGKKLNDVKEDKLASIDSESGNELISKDFTKVQTDQEGNLLVDSQSADTHVQGSVNLVEEEHVTIIDTVKVYIDSIVIRDSVVIRDSIVNRSNYSNWEVSVGGALWKGMSNVSYIHEAAMGKSNLTSGFNIGIDYNILKFKLGSGIEYRQNSEEYQMDFITQTNHDSTFIASYNPYIIYDSVGNVDTTILIPVYDTLTTTTTTSSNLMVRSNVSWVSIPLRFQYQIDWGRWSFIPGVGLNLSIAVSGNPNQPIPWINNSINESKMRLNYQFSLTLRNQFGSKGNFVFVQPCFVNQINNTTYRYANLGFNFGVGFRL